MDSFDSATVLRAAVVGEVLDSQLRRVILGGPQDADTKRLRIYLSLKNLGHAIEHGLQVPSMREVRGKAAPAHLPGQGMLFAAGDAGEGEG